MKRDTELINIAAQIVRLEYLPSLYRCRTIQDARREVARMSEQHIVLALKLKELAGVPGETQSRGSQRCNDCGGIVTKNTGPVVLGRCNQCHQARGVGHARRNVIAAPTLPARPGDGSGHPGEPK